MPAAKPAAAKSRALKSGDHVFLVDGSGYIFRAYHALPPLNRKSDGLQVNAVLGFCNMLWKLLREMKPDERPTHLAVVFDKSEKTFRTEFYPDYKAHRPDPPDDLIPQFGLIREAVHAFEIPCIEQAGYEADDLIATYAREATAARATTTIVSSDKDLMQLVGPTVVMYDTMKDRRIGRAEVIEKFGVPPEKVIDVQALMGDSTDNVPGVPGIGVKTAAQLIGEYGDLDTLLARAGEIKQDKRRQALIDFAEQARISRTLVTLEDRVPLDVAVADLAVHDPDYKRLIAFLKAMEFSSLTRRVAEAAGVDPGKVAPDARLAPKGIGAPVAEMLAPEAEVARPKTDLFEEPRLAARPPSQEEGFIPDALVAARRAEIERAEFTHSRYATIDLLASLDTWMAEAVQEGVLSLVLRTTSPDPMQGEISGLALAVRPNEASYLPLGHRSADDLLAGGGLLSGQIPAAEALKRLKPVLENPGVLKLGHDLKSAVVVLARHGIALAPFDDVMLMSYVLDAGLGGHGLDELATRNLDHAPIAFQDIAGKGRAQVPFERLEIARAATYCAESADVILRLWRLLQARLTAQHIGTVYATLERPLVPVLAHMEQRGIKIERAMLARFSGDFAQTMARLEDEIAELAGERFNLGSPKQLGDILFGKMRLEGGTKTPTGAWSTRANVLEELAEQGIELAQKILDWRQVSKLKSTYTDALPGFVNKDTGRVHTSYALAATTTGRLSSSEPNLQNIPARTEEGRKIRRAFIAAKGAKLVSADYSQIELRLLAEIADVPALRRAFQDETDIHALTASEMFGVPVKGMPSDVRRRAKAINFGIIYGISAFGLANQLGIGREEAAAYIKKYFERFPGIRDYMEETKAFCRQHGYVTTLFGRKMHYPEIKAKNASVRAFNERASINARLQGSAADIIRRAMIRMEPALKQAKLSARMLLQVHDELVFEVDDDEVAKTLSLVAKVMEDAPMPAISLSVPLHVDAHAADNWEEAH